jgi:hypothetical protein
MAGNPTGKGGGIRGKVGGWSKASRRRLRMALLTLAAPEGWCVAGATFTIPGPVVPHEEAKTIWAWFCKELLRSGRGMIWRLELQKRGMLHWHALLVAPDEVSIGRVHSLWSEAVGRLGPFKPAEPYYGESGEWSRGYTFCGSRMALPGADLHASAIDSRGPEASAGAWLRYLQDHASKNKQEQTPSDVGRHWGIVGRSVFVMRIPIKCDDLSTKQYAMVRRAYERLATPHRKADCAFGNRLGWRVKRGRRGRAVCFVNPTTIGKLVAWAKTESPESFDE